MDLKQTILKDNEGESIGTVGSYVQQYKDIEAGKISTAKSPDSFSKKQTASNSLPLKWESSSEKEILLHYAKRLGCLDFTDLEDKRGQIAAAINRLYSAGLTPSIVSKKITEHITPEDLFVEDAPVATLENPSSEKAKEKRSRVADMPEGNYSYIAGLTPLTSEQLDLCRFISPKNLVFSSNAFDYFLALVPGKENSFDNLFNFSTREQLVFEMFKDQLGDDYKAKKLVLMSRLLNESTDTESAGARTVRKTGKKKTGKKLK